MIIDWLIGIGVAGIVIAIIYKSANTADEIVGEPPTYSDAASVVEKPKKMSKARLNALTKVQLEEKGRELGIEVDKRLLKAKIVNEVYKAQ